MLYKRFIMVTSYHVMYKLKFLILAYINNNIVDLQGLVVTYNDILLNYIKFDGAIKIWQCKWKKNVLENTLYKSVEEVKIEISDCLASKIL